MGSSLDQNPPTAQLHISGHATVWLWVVFAIMLLSTMFVLFWSFVQPRGQRAFHHISLVILVVATVAYFSMASNLGQTAIRAEFNRSHTPPITRNIFYVRYIQYFINAPLIVLMLLLATGFPLSEIFVTIFFTLLVVVMGLVGALTASRYKWGYWTMGVAALFYVIFQLLGSGARSHFLAHRRGYMTGAGYVAFWWLWYPMIWAFCEGGNVINPTAEMVWYGIIDLITGPVFLFTHLQGIRNVDYNTLGFASGKATDFGPGAGAGVGAGSGAATGAATGAAAGAATREKGANPAAGVAPATTTTV